MSNRPGEVFKNLAEFDDGIRRIIPHYDLVLDEGASRVPTDASRVLELGSGTGELTLRLLQRCPNAMVVAVDYSARMNGYLAEKLMHRGLSERVEIVAADLSTPQVLEPVGSHGSFHACVSSFTLHHLTDSARASLLRQVFRQLHPGAGCWLADSMLPESTTVEPLYHDARRRWMNTCGVDESSLLGRMVLAKPFGQSDDHHHATMDTYLDQLSNAGFANAFPLFKYFGISICGAWVPA